MAVVFMAVMPIVAQHADCNGQHEYCKNKQTVLTGDDAVAWAKEQVGQLIDNYLASAGNKLDPDELRKQLAPIGYDGTNVPDYRAAEKWLVDTVYRRMMQVAIANGNRSITLLTGPGASGKSTTTKKLDFSNLGLLYDSAFNGYPSLKKAVDKAVKAGMDEFDALRAITINPARHIGIGDRVGSIEVGKDADLVLAPGDIMLSSVAPEAVFLNGVRAV